MNLLRNCKSLTLLELLLAIVLLSVIVIGLTSIDLFSRFHVVTANRRTVIQNDVSYALEHMSREISRAIGNEMVFGNNSVVNLGAIGGDTAIRVYIDGNMNGQRETPPTAATDFWRTYRFTGIAGPNPFQIRYCPLCTNPPACTTCNEPWGNNILSRNIQAVTFIKPGAPGPLSANFIEILLTARWNPAQAVSLDNPEVTMRARIKMPSVSAN